MTFRNPTKNQHFISQAEQKLNAIDPTRPRDLREIYEFLIVQPDPPKLSPPTVRRIEHNLSALDLFSFNVIDHRYRDNLEAQFQAYEQRIADHSLALIAKLAKGSLDIKTELVEVFAAKFLNMVRNPFSITKMLNTVGEAETVTPTDPTLKALLATVATGSRPHETAVCSDYGITPSTYERWLRSLFMLLGPRGDRNIFEGTIARLFSNNFIRVGVCEFTDADPANVCLLSDRGVAFVIEKDDEVWFGFNITSKAFAIYAFADPAKFSGAKPGLLIPDYKVNDLPALADFNERTVFYAAHSVMAAGPTPRLSI